MCKCDKKGEARSATGIRPEARIASIRTRRQASVRTRPAGASGPFGRLKNIARFLREPKTGFGGNRCDQVLESQENRRTETAVGPTRPQEGCWMCMVIMYSPSIG